MKIPTDRYQRPRGWDFMAGAADVLAGFTGFAALMVVATRAPMPVVAMVGLVTGFTAMLAYRVLLLTVWVLRVRRRVLKAWRDTGRTDLIGDWSNEPVYGRDWARLETTPVTASQYRAYRDALALSMPVPIPAVEALLEARITPDQVRWLAEYAPRSFTNILDIADAADAGLAGQDLIPVGRAFHLSRVPVLTDVLSRAGSPAATIAALARDPRFSGRRLPQHMAAAAETALIAEVAAAAKEQA